MFKARRGGWGGVKIVFYYYEATNFGRECSQPVVELNGKKVVRRNSAGDSVTRERNGITLQCVAPSEKKTADV